MLPTLDKASKPGTLLIESHYLQHNMNDTFSLKVKVNAERPDFRVFGTYFFGDDFHNYDSEGNSFPVWSRTWTELYMRSRQEKEAWFDISWIDQSDTSMLKVSANNIENARMVAYFLAKETAGEVFDNNDDFVPLETLENNPGDFELEARLLLAAQSIWRKSSATNPYPNLE